MSRVPAKKAVKAAAAEKNKTTKSELDALLNVSSVDLEGEDADGFVPVYDTCNEIRRKIRAFLKQPGMTQAAFLRAVSQCHPDRKPISATSLARFMNPTKKSPTAGCTTAVFYGAYVFFEKLRVRDRKPKSKLREEMERVWGSHVDPLNGRRGFTLTTKTNQWYTVHESEQIYEDKYGWMHFEKRW